MPDTELMAGLTELLGYGTAVVVDATRPGRPLPPKSLAPTTAQKEYPNKHTVTH